MLKTDRPETLLIGDHLALDLLNSIGSPKGKEIEWLLDGNDLLKWLLRTNLITKEIATHCEDNFSAEQLDNTCKKVRQLRETFREYIEGRTNGTLSASDVSALEFLNKLLKRDRKYIQLSDELTTKNSTESDENTLSHQSFEETLTIKECRHWSSADDLLLPLAEEMANISCNTNFDMVKQCDGPKCTMWFLDITKNHRRRWCVMEVCGNRAKAAAYRAKKRAQENNI